METPKTQKPPPRRHTRGTATFKNTHHDFTVIRQILENLMAGAVMGVAMLWLVLAWADWSTTPVAGIAVAEVAR